MTFFFLEGFLGKGGKSYPFGAGGSLLL